MLSKFLAQLIGLVGLVSLLGYSYQIVMTWLYHPLSIGWFAEFAVYTLTWAMFLSWSEIVRIDRHIRADFLIHHIAATRQRWIEVFNCSVGIGFSLLMLWYGWQLTWDAWVWNDRSPTGFAFPLWIYYSAAPVAGLLMAWRYTERLAAYVTAFDAATMKIA